MLDASKRKNDDKAKRSPYRPMMFIAFVITFIGVLWRVNSYPNAARPTGQIFYTRDNEPMVLNLQTGERATYEPTPLPPYDPTIRFDRSTSPDGKWRIKWVPMRRYGTTFYLIVTNTETQIGHAIGPIYSSDYGPGGEWTPDGQSLYFAAMTEPFTSQTYDDNKVELWRIDIPTQQLIRLTNNTYKDQFPTISPDGTKLVYIAVPDGYSRLHIMDLATVQSIMPAPDMYIFSGSWSPDSQWFAFETNHANGVSDIWITRADGTETQGIALDPNAWEGSPLWKP